MSQPCAAATASTIAEQAFLRELPDLGAVHLHGGRRIAGGDARLQNLIGVHAGAAGDGGVLPGDARLLVGVLDDLHGVRLAARGPEVHQLERRSCGVSRSDPDGGEHRQGTDNLVRVFICSSLARVFRRDVDFV